ncbi:MAG: hypothetical protein GWO24_34330, partial [Akkermansiaceae bacterium]|nr:hypothetical protein [Akkermansiaceae bacterium]
MKRFPPGPVLTALGVAGALACAQDLQHAALDSPYGTYGDNGLPFFCQTLDARKLGPDWPGNNLTPRGLILQLDHGAHVCFDPDLLRVAVIWEEKEPGNYLTMNGMAPGSYRQPHRKAPGGQRNLPTPLGEVIMASDLSPGMLLSEDPAGGDPRTPCVDPDEPGRGPLPPELGRWVGIRLDRDGPTLVYEISGVRIEER